MSFHLQALRPVAGPCAVPAHPRYLPDFVTWIRRGAAKLKADPFLIGDDGMGTRGRLALLVATIAASDQTRSTAVAGWSARTSFTVMEPAAPDRRVPSLKVSSATVCQQAACPGRWVKQSLILWATAAKRTARCAPDVQDHFTADYQQATRTGIRLTVAGPRNAPRLVNATSVLGEELGRCVWNEKPNGFTTRLT